MSSAAAASRSPWSSMSPLRRSTQMKAMQHTLKRRWQLCVTATLAFLAVCFTVHYMAERLQARSPALFGVPSFSKMAVQHHPQQQPDGNVAPGRYAYVSLLCDDGMLESTLVLARSLLDVQAQYPYYILGLPGLSAAARELLLHPQSGVSAIIDIEPLQYPFEQSASRLAINKPCRYSKLQLWSLTQYDKLVFLDADVMVVKNVDHLFQYPEFSATVDVAGVYNTGVFVAEPNEQTYQHMLLTYPAAPSYNKGDQGFLNWFFVTYRDQLLHSNEGTADATTSAMPLPSEHHVLPAVYNMMSKYQEYAIWDDLRDNTHIVHFTAETKPWNFYYTPHEHFLRNLYGPWFHQWIQTYSAVKSTLLNQSTASFTSVSHPLEINRLIADGAVVPAEQSRIHPSDLCQKVWKTNKFTTDCFSVLLGTYLTEDRNRLELLFKLIDHFAQSKLICTIFITWHNPSMKVPQAMKDKIKAMTKPQLKLLHVTTDSLNNRFLPIPGLKSRAVFVTDEDVRVPIEDLELGFQVWKHNQDRLVGYYPRSHVMKLPSTDEIAAEGVEGTITAVNEQPGYDSYRYLLKAKHRGKPAEAPGYSIMLTKGMFVHANFIWTYGCIMPPSVHSYVDTLNNCEDIAFSMMVTGMSGKSPLAVGNKVDEFGAFSGISNGTAHLNVRDMCVTDLIRLMGNTNTTLRYNDQVVRQYDDIPYKKKTLDQW